MIEVEYREIPGYPGYRVSSAGDVQSRWRRGTKVWSDHWSYLSPRPDTNGYLSISLCNAEGCRNTRIHRLVATVFIQNPEGLPCVRHLDGNKANNRVENLAWGTYTDNENDKRRHGTWDTRKGGAKLTAQEVKEIRGKVRAGIRQIDIAREYGVSRPTITRIANNTTWSDT